MSLNKISQCIHKECNQKLIANSKYTFCPQCGVLGICDETMHRIRWFTKSGNCQKTISVDPLEISIQMRPNKTMKDNTISNWYLKNRKKVLSFLQKLTMKLKYSDATFYTSLLYLDQLLSKVDETKNVDIDYLVLSIFLIVAKVNEKSISEPNLNQFINISDEHQFNVEIIKQYEIYALQQLNYNVFDFSTYDWLSLFLNNGFVFEDELELNLSISDIYSFTKKTLATITSKKLFLSFTPFEIAVSLIKVTRDKFNLNNDTFPLFCNLYQINQNEFSSCILSIKDAMNHKIQSVTPNIDTLKINTRYQITCFNMKPKSNTSLKTIYRLKEEEKLHQKKKHKTIKMADLTVINSSKSKNQKKYALSFVDKPKYKLRRHSVLNTENCNSKISTMSSTFIVNTQRNKELITYHSKLPIISKISKHI